MSHEVNLGKTIARGWKKIFLFSMLALILATGLSFTQTLKYSSSIRLLIIQPSAIGFDPYTAIRAAEQISNNLAQVVFTTDFFNKVSGGGFSIDQNYFPTDDGKRRKLWSRTVDVQVERGTGLLNITVYHPDRTQATQIARAIAHVMTTEGSNYVGGSALQIRLVDDPLVSRFPVRPNVLANAFTGLVLGFLFGVVYVGLLGSSRKHLVEHPPAFI